MRKLITYYLILITFSGMHFLETALFTWVGDKAYTGHPVMVVRQVVRVVTDAIQAASAGAND